MFQEKYKHPSKVKPGRIRSIMSLLAAYTVGEKFVSAEADTHII